MSVCLDAFAVLTWLQNEDGAVTVEGYLTKAVENQDFSCFISLINLGEVFYRLARVPGPAAADRFWEEVRGKILPIRPIDATRRRVREAAVLKSRYPIAFADAFAAQLAMEFDVPLITGDPEIRAVEAEEKLRVLWLPTSAG